MKGENYILFLESIRENGLRLENIIAEEGALGLLRRFEEWLDDKGLLKNG